MNTAIPQPAPELLCKAIDQDHAYVVNCSYPNSFRVLNKTQSNILNAINGRDDVNTIARRLDIAEDLVEKFISILSKTEIVRYDGLFSRPKRPDKPESLAFWIHTTNACNLGCNYCYIPTLNTGKAMVPAVQHQLITKLIEAAEKQGIKSVRLRLAGGEPLSQFNAWKSFIPQARIALENVGCTLDISFLTNLTILTPEIVAFSKANNISFGVSLDGVGEIHDATRKFRSGTGSFDIVDRNIRQLIESGVAVSVNTVLNNFNLWGIPDLTRYLISLNIPFRYSIVKGEAIHPEMLNENLLEACQIMRDAISGGWQYSRRFQFCDLKPNELGFQTCASGFSGGAIYTDGSFKYCHVQFGKEASASQTIFDEGVDLVQMIEQGEHQEDNKSDDCKKCRYRAVCTSGCPVYRQDGKDPNCSLYHTFIPRFYELQAIERLQLLRKCEKL